MVEECPLTILQKLKEARPRVLLNSIIINKTREAENNTENLFNLILDRNDRKTNLVNDSDDNSIFDLKTKIKKFGNSFKAKRIIISPQNNIKHLLGPKLFSKFDTHHISIPNEFINSKLSRKSNYSKKFHLPNNSFRKPSRLNCLKENFLLKKKLSSIGVQTNLTVIRSIKNRIITKFIHTPNSSLAIYPNHEQFDDNQPIKVINFHNRLNIPKLVTFPFVFDNEKRKQIRTKIARMSSLFS